MTFNDETKKAVQEGPNQLSHLFYRHDLNDRDNHDQRHGRAGAAEAEVTTKSEVSITPGGLTHIGELPWLARRR